LRRSQPCLNGNMKLKTQLEILRGTLSRQLGFELKILRFLCFSIVAFFCESSHCEFLPQAPLLERTVMDQEDHRNAFRYTSQKQVEIDVGVSFALWQSNHKNLLLGIEGGAQFLLRAEGARLPLESSDGIFGIFVEGKIQNLLWQLRFKHVSAHLSDGLFNKRQPINYSLENLALKFLWAQKYFRPYLAVHCLTNSIPSRPSFNYQVGWEFRFFESFFSDLYLLPSWGVDLKVNSANEFTFKTILALAMKSSHNPQRQWVFTLNYQAGQNPRGQFYQEKLSQYSLGIEFIL